METKNKKCLSDGNVQIDEVTKDLHNMIYLNNPDTALVRSLHHLISKLTIVKEIMDYNPRLPLYQIEQVIISICREDPYLNGVDIRINFLNKYDSIDESKIGRIKVNV